MKIFELIVDELAEFLGFDANSLVSNPAHEESFYAFNHTDVEDLITLEVIKDAMLQYTSFDETLDPEELKIGDYQTRHYDMCPGASALYRRIENQEVNVDMGLAIRAAKLQDALFWLEKHTLLEMKYASFEDVKAAEILAGEIMHLARMMGLEEEHQYVYKHIQIIRELYLQGDRLELDIDVSALPDYVAETTGSIVYENFQSYNDYPVAASDNAARAVKYAEENGWGDCGTPVGKQRAHQLANRRPVTEETIARMASFARHRHNSKTPYGEGCGKLMWDSWGGDEGVAWAQRKLDMIQRQEKLSQSFAFASEDQQIVVGPLMVPNKQILRVNEETGEPYLVYFTSETIATIAEAAMRDEVINRLNVEHDATQPIKGHMISSWVVKDPEMDTSRAYGFKAYPKGIWFGMYRVLDPAVWLKVKSGELTGFSIEAYLASKYIKTI